MKKPLCFRRITEQACAVTRRYRSSLAVHSQPTNTLYKPGALFTRMYILSKFCYAAVLFCFAPSTQATHCVHVFLNLGPDCAKSCSLFQIIKWIYSFDVDGFEMRDLIKDSLSKLQSIVVFQR